MSSFRYSLLACRFYASVRQGDKPSAFVQETKKIFNRTCPSKRHLLVGCFSTVTFKNKLSF